MRLLIAGYLALALLGCARANGGTPPGFLEGHLKIISLKEVELGPTDAQSPTPVSKAYAGRYADYPLIVLGRSGKKAIATVTVDEQGHYRVALPPGEYVLDAKGRSPKRIRATPRRFRIVSSRTVYLDMELDTGIR
ncbi:MAG: hypothetical protein WCE48_09680 [Steroidobacteraceae bacterium]